MNPKRARILALGLEQGKISTSYSTDTGIRISRFFALSEERELLRYIISRNPDLVIGSSSCDFPEENGFSHNFSLKQFLKEATALALQRHSREDLFPND